MSFKNQILKRIADPLHPSIELAVKALVPPGENT